MKNSILFASLLCICFIPFAIGCGAPSEAVQAASGSLVTAAQFEKVKVGMSKDEVWEILGPPAETASEGEIAGIHTALYVWYGDNLGIANCNVMIQNGKVVNKAQLGLK